jgi:hypothetical protein
MIFFFPFCLSASLSSAKYNSNEFQDWDCGYAVPVTWILATYQWDGHLRVHPAGKILKFASTNQYWKVISGF